MFSPSYVSRKGRYATKYAKAQRTEKLGVLAPWHAVFDEN
jgi:hypothetical protein